MNMCQPPAFGVIAGGQHGRMREKMMHMETIYTIARDNDGPEFYTGTPYVANDDGEIVYNPRFGKSISASAGALINSNDDNLRG